MYHSHFGLNQSPFSITPNPAFFYSGSKRGDILDALIYAVTHGEGIIKVTGEVGSGKTMLCRMLEGLMPAHVEVIYLVNPTLSREEVVFTIAGELSIPTEGKRPDEVIRLLHQDLITKHINGKQVVLLVEEAQAMPLDTLEEIRLFSNLETAHHKLLQIVLFGQPELDENLNLPSMRQLKERITHSFLVPPMPPALIPEFLMFRMRAAGYHGPNVFSKAAIKRLAKVSEGIVRRINILADKALLAAFADNTHAVEAKHINAAIRDSEFSSKKPDIAYQPISLAILSMLLLSGLAYWAHWSWKTNNANKVAELNAPATITATAATKKNAGINTTPVALTATQTNTVKNEQDPVSTSSPRSEKLIEPVNSVSTAPPATENTSVLQLRVAQSKKWLAETPDHFYTIQLSLVDNSDASKLEALLKQYAGQFGIDNIYLYPTKLANQARYGIVYNSFNKRENAWQKRKELEETTAIRAQLRTIEGLKSEMERSQSADLW
ncbi:ExeA family protein [Undibacterium sp. Di24W]|uniref:ExeA family protein n=1 Tax=Undibacterium sp. Di24W TaxID=3413033 RepID=UPI003BF0E4D4